MNRVVIMFITFVVVLMYCVFAVSNAYISISIILLSAMCLMWYFCHIANKLNNKELETMRKIKSLI